MRMRAHIGVIPVAAVDETEPLYESLLLQKLQIPVHRGEPRLGQLLLEMRLHPFGARVRFCRPQNFQYRIAVFRPSCVALHQIAPFLPVKMIIIITYKLIITQILCLSIVFLKKV